MGGAGTTRPSVGRRRLLGWGVAATAVATAGLVGLGTDEALAGGEHARSSLPPSGRGRLAADVLFRGPADRKAIALTFDDGPSGRWTPEVLDLLARHGIRATFFLVGARALAHPALVQRQVRAGHQIGNHSWDHVDLVKHSPDVVSRQLRRTDILLQSMTQARPTAMRPPWGHIDPPGLLAASELGYRVVLWSELIRGSRPREDTDATLASIGPGAIVLAHDGGPTPTSRLYTELDRFIATMLGNGYAFVTVDELAAQPSPTIPHQGDAQHR